MSQNPVKNEQAFQGITTFTRLLFLIVAGTVFFISKYAFTFFIFAILPSITAIFIDKRAHKFASSSICAFNITAIMPYLFFLLESQNISSTAQEFIRDINVWFAIYGITSLGWIVIWSIPQICGKIFQIRALNAIYHLKSKQNDFISEWGAEVSRDGTRGQT